MIVTIVYENKDLKVAFAESLNHLECCLTERISFCENDGTKSTYLLVQSSFMQRIDNMSIAQFCYKMGWEVA